MNIKSTPFPTQTLQVREFVPTMLLNQYETAAEHQIDQNVTDLAKSDQSKTVLEVFDQPSYILYPIDKPQGKRS